MNAARIKAARRVGYLPEERGLYPGMHAREAIAFMGALRGLPLAEGRLRADALLESHGLGDARRKPIRTLSKGMAQMVQIIKRAQGTRSIGVRQMPVCAARGAP